MRIRQQGIQNFLLRQMTVIVTISFGLLLTIWIYSEYAFFVSELKSSQEVYLSSQKAQLRSEVNNVFDYINYMKTQTEKRLRAELKGRVYEAVAIAENIFRENAASRSSDEIKKMVKDALRPIRFLNGRGYFFAFSMDGIETLFADRPEMEGVDMLPIRGAKGEYVVRDMIDIVKEQQEGFYQYTWTKPAHGGRNFPKIAFVKYFQSFDWAIGTGEYLDDFTEQMQNTVLNRIVGLRFGDEGYFFGSMEGGYPLFTNGKITKGGERIWDMTDPNGVKIIQEQQKAARKPGGGFVQYAWHKLSEAKLSTKLSFVREISDWGWTVGAGVYLDTIEETISKNQSALRRELVKKIAASVGVFAVLIVLIWFWAKTVAAKTRKSIDTFESFFKRATTESVTIPVDEMQFDELCRIADSANKMIEDQKQSEAALRDSEERFRELFNHMSPGVAIYSSPDDGQNFVFRDMNKSGLENTQKKREEVVDREVREVFPGVEALGLFDVFKRVWQTGIPENYPSKLYKDDRIEIWVENYVCKLPSGELVAIYEDTTAQKKAEEALSKSEERLKLALDSVSDAVWDWRVDTGEVYFSSRWYTMLGYEPYELPQAFATWRSLLHPDDLPQSEQTVFGHLELAKPFEIEFRMRTKTGQWKWILARGKTVEKDDQGNAVRMLGTHVDITERKKMEERIQQAQKMESIGNLAGGIAHDFNNILFPIVGMSEMLLEDLPPGSPEHESVQEILKAGRRGSDLVKQILAFSRQTEHRMMPVRVQNVLEEVLKLSRSTIPSDIEILRDIQSDCGMVVADPTQLHQVAMNLVTNAYHAVEENGGNISVELKEIDLETQDSSGDLLQQGPYAILSVSDTGNGIDPDVMDKIFDPYFTTKAQGKGTGLGLAVVYGIVREHGGDIKVYSEPGKGTTFNVYLPQKRKFTDALLVEKTVELETGNERILLVDDEEPIVKLESNMLRRLGYHVTSRVSSLEALAAFKAAPDAFDLVLTDMTMPNMTGDQLARALLSIKPDIPIIVCTGFSERISREKAEAIGIKGFLMKPVVRSELSQMIRKALKSA